MKRKLLLPLLALFLLAVPQVRADVYKCVSEKGVTTYSDQPCAPDAQAAYKDARVSFDEVIGNASPYPELPVPSSRVHTDDIVSHATKIGKAVLPSEYNNKVINLTGPGSPGWHIELWFGPEDNPSEYQVSLFYRRNPHSNGTLDVWLHTLSVLKDSKPFDPPSMADVKSFRKVGTGRWDIRQN